MLAADEVPTDGAELDVPDVGGAVGEVGADVGDVGAADVGAGEAFLVGAAEVRATLVGATDWPGAAGGISAVAEGVLSDARALGCVDGTAADVDADAVVADGDGAVGSLWEDV